MHTITTVFLGGFLFLYLRLLSGQDNHHEIINRLRELAAAALINYRSDIPNMKSYTAAMLRQEVLGEPDGIAWEALRRVEEKTPIPD